MRATITRKQFESMLVQAPPLENSDEAVAFDKDALNSMQGEGSLIRRVFPFEVPPHEREKLFPSGREVFVHVERGPADLLVGVVFSIPTEVLNSKRATLPAMIHHFWKSSKNPDLVGLADPSLVSTVCDQIFGNKNYENN